MGAWIEIGDFGLKEGEKPVAPAWGRGLKSHPYHVYGCGLLSPPHGGVD